MQPLVAATTNTIVACRTSSFPPPDWEIKIILLRKVRNGAHLQTIASPAFDSFLIGGNLNSGLVPFFTFAFLLLFTLTLLFTFAVTWLSGRSRKIPGVSCACLRQFRDAGKWCRVFVGSKMANGITPDTGLNTKTVI